jgi:hypothetical protein
MSSYNSGSAGTFNRLKYDNCAYQKTLYESTSPSLYRLYEGNFENKDKCVNDNNNFWRPFDLVDIETELKGLYRPGTKCPQFKYSPACTKSSTCTSTFDKSVPIVLAHEVCPIVTNNIPKIKNVGYEIVNKPFASNGKRNTE